MQTLKVVRAEIPNPSPPLSSFDAPSINSQAGVGTQKCKGRSHRGGGLAQAALGQGS